MGSGHTSVCKTDVRIDVGQLVVSSHTYSIHGFMKASISIIMTLSTRAAPTPPPAFVDGDRWNVLVGAVS